MLYFTLPSTYLFTYKNIINTIDKEHNETTPIISNSLHLHLNELQKKIQEGLSHFNFTKINNKSVELVEIMDFFYENLPINKYYHFSATPNYEMIDGIITAKSKQQPCLQCHLIGATTSPTQHQNVVPIQNPLDFADFITLESDNFDTLIRALSFQKIEGHMVIKINNCFSENVVKTLYLLASCYKKVILAKPQSSWIGNSTKYIICKDFKLYPFKIIYNSISKKYLNIKMSVYFLNKLEEINCVFIQQQMDNLSNKIKI